MGQGGKRIQRKTAEQASPAVVRKLLSALARDFEPWKESGITLEMVEAAYCIKDADASMRIQVSTYESVAVLTCFSTEAMECAIRY